MINLDRLSRNNRALYLAYDQGLEHGPSDFNDESVNPENILKIAASGFYTGVILQKGIVEKYYVPAVETLHATSLRNDILQTSEKIPAEINNTVVANSRVCPLILKLNGKTRLANDEPMAEQICTVDEAVKLGAAAVGYTIYLGSEFEEQMLKEFSAIEREAHSSGVPVIAWMYPRGSSVKSPDSSETIAYAARVGLEIGADIVKVRIPAILSVANVMNAHCAFRSPEATSQLLHDLQWIVKSAGRCKVVFAGGSKLPEPEFLETARLTMQSGAFGLAVGRNIWQSVNPLDISEKLSQTVFQ